MASSHSVPVSPNVRRYGRDESLPQQIPLRAGPISLLFEAGCLRNVRLGENEILRRVYVAIRDQSWGTAPDEISNLQIDAESDRFRILYDVSNRLDDIDFSWRGEITGDSSGTVHFSMDGEARCDFLRARIGFCVLPPMTVAGHKARIAHVDGTVDETPFPVAIAPQMVIDGEIKPVSPFNEMRSLAYEIAPGTWAEVEFSGDIFEMEDQRNWTDASYKIYSTPLRIPFPVQIHSGDRVRQNITVHLDGDGSARPADESDVAEIVLSSGTVGALPEIGLGLAGSVEPHTPQEVERLRALRLSHLRVDIDLRRADYAEVFGLACQEAAAVGTALEVALFADEESARDLDALAQIVHRLQPRIARWLVFGADGMSYPGLAARVRAAFSTNEAAISVGGGTNGYFTDLNRERPDVSSVDVVAYSVNPQVHAFDNDSLMETPAAQAVTVASAALLCAGKPIAVSPITLLPRFNPHASQEEPEAGRDRLPPQVDVRQMSLFGAAWTVASLKYLSESGASSVTYFETRGWRGVMETEQGSPLPELFPSTPGGVFPMYHVFADVGEVAGGEVMRATSSLSRNVEAMAVRHKDGVRVLVANLRGEAQKVALLGVPGSVAAVALNEESFGRAVSEPERYRAQRAPSINTPSGVLDWTLAPYAVLRVDFK